MQHKGRVQRRPRRLIWGVGFCFVVALSTLAVGGLRLRPIDVRGWQTIMLTAVVALILLLGIVCQHRIRAAGRWKAALNAYAEREIARDGLREDPTTMAPPDDTRSISFETLKDRL